MGTVRTLAIQPDERHRLAVHEAGHTAAAYYNPGADPLYKVTIIPRGRSLGGTHMLPEHERHTLSEDYLRVQLTTLLTGRAAEKTLLGSVSSGADDDIRRATIMARSMVARWGMDPEIGPIDLRQSEDHPFLGQQIAQPRSFADETAARVDQAVIDLLHEAEKQATSLFRAHWQIGTPQRIAFEILLFTGLRRSDAVRLGRQHIQGDRIVTKIKKSQDEVEVSIPVHADFRRVLETIKHDHLNLIVTAYGAARSEKAFTNWIIEAARSAGLPPHRSPHGLRKSACIRLAEAGCSASEIMSITGHRNLAEVETYVREANKKKLADSAINKTYGAA